MIASFLISAFVSFIVWVSVGTIKGKLFDNYFVPQLEIAPRATILLSLVLLFLSEHDFINVGIIFLIPYSDIVFI